ncbi:hypothetical protein SUDANB105_07476 [Streptomyces sp. enrichment culture]|uniref:hypothetical protein n=1 Tax=Streptomyces sp. enrichment culture TaxID=1795815 RepID=UPI003F554759
MSASLHAALQQRLELLDDAVVACRIRDTLRRLDEQHPALAAHLRGAVSTGTMCRYTPDQDIRWQL